jgi:hypothetical protein
MAKISARGAYAIATLRATKTFSDQLADGTEDNYTIRCLFTLRSDGKVLSRIRSEKGRGGSGYSVYGTLKKGIPMTEETLKRIVEKRGYAIEG